jgi:hypothetical protein
MAVADGRIAKAENDRLAKARMQLSITLRQHDDILAQELSRHQRGSAQMQLQPRTRQPLLPHGHAGHGGGGGDHGAQNRMGRSPPQASLVKYEPPKEQKPAGPSSKSISVLLEVDSKLHTIQCEPDMPVSWLVSEGMRAHAEKYTEDVCMLGVLNLSTDSQPDLDTDLGECVQDGDILRGILEQDETEQQRTMGGVVALMWGDALGFGAESEAKLRHKIRVAEDAKASKAEGGDSKSAQEEETEEEEDQSFLFSRQLTLLRHEGATVLQVSCGYRHTGMVLMGGRLLTWGCGECGRLGHGDERNLKQPKLVQALFQNKVVEVACGHAHTAAVVEEGGGLFSWGWGEAGRLGRGELGKERLPKKVKFSKGCLDAVGERRTRDRRKERERAAQYAMGRVGALSLLASVSPSTHAAVATAMSPYFGKNKGEGGTVGHTDAAGSPAKKPCSPQSGGSPDVAPHTISTPHGPAPIGSPPRKTRDSAKNATAATIANGGVGGGGRIVGLFNRMNNRLIVSKVAVGHEHTLAVTADGVTLSCGAGGFGRLGLGRCFLSRSQLNPQLNFTSRFAYYCIHYCPQAMDGMCPS